MLLKTGRHRRPRQAPSIIVAAGVTSSAIVIPLFGASAANAAGTPWDKVAECESGGSWSANLNYGYYGGLRISHTDWEKYGGLTYALRPDEASRSQQIAVAEKILASQGTAPWANCTVPSGLTKHSGSGPVNTGVANDPASTWDADGSSHYGSGPYDHGLSNSSLSHSSLPDAALPPVPSGPSSPSTDPSDSAAASPSSSGSPDPSVGISADPSSPPPTTGCCVASDEPPSPGSSDSTTAGATLTTPPEAGASDSRHAVGSWSLIDTGITGDGEGTGTGRHRGDSAQETPTNTPASSGRHASHPDKPTTGEAHTVRAGDTLTSIAHSLGVSGGWSTLYAENEAVIGPNPDHILPGQSVKTHRGLEEGAAAAASVGTPHTEHEPGNSNM